MQTVTNNNDNLINSVLAANEPLVLFRTAGMIMAAPLGQAYRFDEIDYYAGATQARYYDGDINVHCIGKMPSGRKPVIVFGEAGFLEGLIVDEIMDIVAYNGILPQTSEPVSGNAMIRGQVTEIVNLRWFTAQSSKAA